MSPDLRGLGSFIFASERFVGISLLTKQKATPRPSPLVAGAAITEVNNTTFTLNRDGIYRVTYTLRTALLSLLGSVQVQINGSGVGSTSGLILAGAPPTDQVTFAANAGDTMQLVVGGFTLSLATGDNATINIDKIQ